MSKYKATTSTAVIRVADGAVIPDDPNNMDYQEHLKWVTAGGVVDPIDPPTQAEIDAAAQAIKDRQDRQNAKADNKFQNLISKTPAQAKNWVQNNFPSLTPAEQNDLATVVQAVCILARSL